MTPTQNPGWDGLDRGGGPHGSQKWCFSNKILKGIEPFLDGVAPTGNPGWEGLDRGGGPHGSQKWCFFFCPGSKVQGRMAIGEVPPLAE